MGIRELEFRVVDLALIRSNRSVKLADKRGLRVELLLGNNVFLEKKLESFEIHFRVSALSLIFGELSQCLFKLDLEGSRIDLREEISFVDELTFLEGDTDELAIDAAADGDGIESSDRAETVEVHGQVAASCGGNNNGYHKIARTRASLTLAGGTGRGGVCRLAGGARAKEIPDTNGNHAKNENPKPPTRLRGRRTRPNLGAAFGKVYGLELAHSFAPVM
jgi:hypothetical protein